MHCSQIAFYAVTFSASKNTFPPFFVFVSTREKIKPVFTVAEL